MTYFKNTKHNREDLRDRATRETDGVLRVWTHDGRKWVRDIAAAEIARREAAAA